MWDKIFFGFLAIAFFGLIISVIQFALLISEPSPAGSKTSAMSPCQCKVAGGCSITWLPKEGLLYSDGTSPDFYDDYGFYVGVKDVPNQCRRT